MSKSGRLPEYVVRRLERMGLRDPDTGATRRAVDRYCLVCRAHVMRGIDRPFGGMSRDLDPEPLSRLGEALALMSGRRTFTLRWIGDRYEIDSRDSFSIRGSPAGSVVGCDVLVEHVCGADELPHGPTQIVDSRPLAAPLGNDPPF